MDISSPSDHERSETDNIFYTITNSLDDSDSAEYLDSVSEFESNINTASSDDESNWFVDYSVEEYSDVEGGFVPKPASQFVLDKEFKNGTIPVLNRKVHRGTRASVYEFPFIVSIRRNLAHVLTGVVVTPSFVLTVAQGVYKVPVYDLTLVVSENYSDRGTDLMPIAFCIIHQDFDPYTLQGDIALLRTKYDMMFKGNLKEIMILRPSIPVLDTEATVAGWGRCDLTGKEVCVPRSVEFYPNEIQDPMLRSARFQLDSTEYCDVYTKKMNLTLYPGMLCAGRSRLNDPLTSCMAVPGAPLIVYSFLVGLQSWGYGCGYKQDLPLVYTDVRFYTRWLESNLMVFLNITTEQVFNFYLASHAYVMTRSLRLLRGLPPISDNGTRILEEDPIDKQISLVQGTLYDYRDFVFDGNYSNQKQQSYENHRELHRNAQLMALNNPMNLTECPQSFLHKEDHYFLYENESDDNNRSWVTGEQSSDED